MPGIGKAAAPVPGRHVSREDGAERAAMHIVCQAAAEFAREGDPGRATRQAATAEVTDECDPSCAAATSFGATTAGITGEGGPGAAAGPR